MDTPETLNSEIAVIGLSGRFPGARNVAEFWENLKKGVESISYFSDDELKSAGIPGSLLKNKHYVKVAGILDHIEMFDAPFFELTPREAAVIDPQQRFMLECAWEALEDAGYNSDTFDGRIGIFAGANMNTYMFQALTGNHDPTHLADILQLCVPDHLSTRAAYKLNLRGPAVNVITACSTSLVAVHLACQGLLNGECDMALAGGVTIGVPQQTGYLYREGYINSPDGHSRSFDHKARGTISSNGIGIVVLRRLEEAREEGDFVHALIIGSAVNNDGSLKAGYTAPSVESQIEVINEALSISGVEADSITYIETHGTATPIGDPIEIAGLIEVFGSRTGKKQFCALGSVKTNIGHLGAAAGAAGLIKTILSLRHRLLVPHLHFEKPNPQIDFQDSPFYINTSLSEWRPDGEVRRAGVSSFGIGGTNAHLVLEEAPRPAQERAASSSRPCQLVLLSARTAAALDTMTENLCRRFRDLPPDELADAAYILKVGRRPFRYRRMAVSSDLDEAVDILSSRTKKLKTSCIEREDVPVAFLLAGQGSQYVNMGRGLYENEPLFRRELLHCFDVLKSISASDQGIEEIIYPEHSNDERIQSFQQRLNQTVLTQPVLFIFEYAVARMLMSWGIRPCALLGYSLGEYIAACLSGVFSLEDALKLVVFRGELMQKTRQGAMLSVPLPENEIKPLLPEAVSLAIVNGPSCIVSGPREAVEAFENRMKERRLVCAPLNIAFAMHSPLMNPIRREFEERLEQVELNRPDIPFISNVSGRWITHAEAVDPAYWGRHMCSTVRFSDGIKELLKEEDVVFLEIGPGKELAGIVQNQAYAGSKSGRKIVNVIRNQQEKVTDDYLLQKRVGELWLWGVPIDWTSYYWGERRNRIPLPAYPFERQPYWIKGGLVQPLPSAGTAVDRQANQSPSEAGIPYSDSAAAVEDDLSPRRGIAGEESDYVAPRNDLENRMAAIYQEVLGFEKVGIHDDFFALHGTSLIATQIVSRLIQIYPIDLTINDFLQHPTIARLAELIEGLIIEKINRMSDEEVAMLSEQENS